MPASSAPTASVSPVARSPADAPPLALGISLALALAGGAATALAFAPLDLWPLGLAGVALLMWLVTRAGGAWQAGLAGWLFGTAMFAVSLNWIATAFTFQSRMPAALGWVAVVGLSLYLALFIAVPAALASLARGPLARVIALIALWLPAEWARGVLLTGFAWNPLGALWLPLGGVAQLAALLGAIGLSLLALLVSAGLLWLAVGPGRLVRAGGGGLVALALVVGLVGNGRIIESGFIGPSLVVVQPGIGQDERYDAAAEEERLRTYLDLTRTALARVEANARTDLPDVTIRETDIEEAPAIDSPLRPSTGKVTGNLENQVAAGLAAPAVDAIAGGQRRRAVPVLPRTGQDGGQAGGQGNGPTPAGPRAPITGRPAQTTPTLVLWPEGAIDGLIEEDLVTRARIARVLRPGDMLLAGGTGVRRDGGRNRYANSLFAIDARAEIVGRYDKAHLVPLGEYLPQRSLTEPLGLARLVPGEVDFTPGPGPQTLRLPGFLGVSPVICYEIAFPQAVVQEEPRPAWIANVSNDAWFGPWGPPQHVAQARLRAIEEGLPVARATPTGQTVVIDGYGRVLNQLRDGVAEAIVTTLPPPLPAPLFVQAGHGLVLLLALLLAVAALVLDRRARRL